MGRATFCGVRQGVPMKHLVAVFLAAALTLSSCAVSQTVTLNRDTSGTTDLSISLHKILVDYLVALAESIQGPLPESEKRVFDLEQIRLSFDMQPDIDLLKVTSPDTGDLLLSLRFEALDKVFSASADVRQVFTVKKDGTATKLAFHLDRKNFPVLARLFPLYDLGQSLYLFPDASAPMTEEEYLEYVTWALEGVAGDADVAQVLKNSRISITLAVPSQVVSQEGGRVSGKTVLFQIPVLQVLTLEKPVDLSVTFR